MAYTKVSLLAILLIVCSCGDSDESSQRAGENASQPLVPIADAGSAGHTTEDLFCIKNVNAAFNAGNIRDSSLSLKGCPVDLSSAVLDLRQAEDKSNSASSRAYSHKKGDLMKLCAAQRGHGGTIWGPMSSSDVQVCDEGDADQDRLDSEAGSASSERDRASNVVRAILLRRGFG